MKILFGSDVSFESRDGGITVDNAEERVRSVKPVFDAADFRMVNLENVLYDSTEGAIIKSGPALRSSRHCVAFLTALRVDVAGLANNHFGDFGEAGMQSTWACLEENGIAYIGGGRDVEEAYRAHVFEKDGLRVAVIAVCENEFGTADVHRMGSAGYDPARLADAIRREKQTADYVVVYFHGGNEGAPYPSPKKNGLYRLFTRLGADVVVAMHTHCPQGYEIYEGKPIVYSMGNFYFPKTVKGHKASDPNNSWNFGYLTQLDFTTDGIAMELFPYRFGSIEDPLTLLEGKEKERFKEYLAALCAPIGDPQELRRLFKIWCTVAGIGYAQMTVFQPEMLRDGAALCCHLRNNFCCEAHNELLSTLMEMCYQGEVETYQAQQAAITDMQTVFQ